MSTHQKPEATDRRPTRDDVARMAGVSPATVSYVLNDGPRPVSAAVRGRVLAAVEMLGYQPNLVARSLRLQKRSTVGLILPDLHNSFYTEVAGGAEEAASEGAASLLLTHSGFDAERELRCVTQLINERVGGVVWVPTGHSQEPVRRLETFRIPVVVLDSPVDLHVEYTITADNVAGGRAATQHLIELGHRRIGYIAGPSQMGHSERRRAGYAAALTEAGIPLDPSLVVPGGVFHEEGRRAAAKLLDRPDPPTGIVAYNDLTAIGALRAARELDYELPRDLSVVGFDDVAEARYTWPALTTVAQPKRDMGRWSVEILLHLIEAEPVPTADWSDLPVELVVRESTAPPRAHRPRRA